MKVQRDRGRRKKHHKAQPKCVQHGAVEGAEFVAFHAWLRDEFRDADGAVVPPSNAFKLTKFLQTCPWFDLSPGDKLRWLAVFWEPDCTVMEQPQGWNILKRIYQEAIHYAPEDGYNYHSYSLSARNCAILMKDGSAAQRALLEDAQSVCRTGLEHDRSCSLLHYSLGKLLYDSDEQASAIPCFQSALKLDHKCMWAALYLAHCYHDLKQWQAAADAYGAVDKSFFDGPAFWRALLLREQRASCLYHAGDQDASRDLFERAVSQYETTPGLLRSAEGLIGLHLQEAAELFPEVFCQRVGNLFDQELG